jgi:hypothetical protein
MRALLDESAPQFLEYKKIKAYAGDRYPDGVGKLNSLLGAYTPPEDTVGTALASLQEKYAFNNSEI